MTTRRISVALFTAMALLLSAAVSLAAQQDAADLEILKGTVSKVADKSLHLKGTTFPDGTLGKRDVTFLIDKETSYYDGAKRVNKAELQPGHLVLVKCTMVGKDRKAVLVRIIGGKKL